MTHWPIPSASFRFFNQDLPTQLKVTTPKIVVFEGKLNVLHYVSCKIEVKIKLNGGTVNGHSCVLSHRKHVTNLIMYVIIAIVNTTHKLLLNYIFILIC